ncbi:MAG: vWA domain-containing protein [bacterium]
MIYDTELEEPEEFVNANTLKGTIKTSPALRVLGRYAQLSGEGQEDEIDLRKDCFWSYYLPQPEIKEEPPVDRMVNAAVINWAMSSELFKKSRFSTIGRMAMSSLSADFLAHYLLNDPEVQKALEEQRQAAEMMEQAPEGEDGDAARQAALEKMRNAMEKFQDFGESPQGQAVRARAVQNAKDKGDEAQEVMAGWGVDDGPGSRVDVKAIQEMMKQLNMDFIQQVTQLMGRAQKVGLKVKNTRKKKATVITDAGFTKSVLDVFPSERLLLLDESLSPEAHLMKMGEFGTHGLIGMVSATEDIGEGKLYFIIDGSGSMNERRHCTAKALAMGLSKAAEDSGQGWMGSMFGNSASEFTPPVTNDSPPGEILNFISYMPGGGTNFDVAIEEALKYVDDLPDKDTVDLVFITDGECDMSSETVKLLEEARQRHGIRLFTLLVDGGYGAINDASYYVAEIHSNEDIAKAAEGLAKALWEGE